MLISMSINVVAKARMWNEECWYERTDIKACLLELRYMQNKHKMVTIIFLTLGIYAQMFKVMYCSIYKDYLT